MSHPSLTRTITAAERGRVPATPLQVARHEAAHAVVTVAMCEERLLRVEINRAGHGCTFVAWSKRPDPLTYGVMVLAGHAAEMKWHRVPATLVPRNDHRDVVRIGFRGRSLALLLSLARAQVEEHAEAIERVARALLAAPKVNGKRELSGRAVRKLIGSSAAARKTQKIEKVNP